MEEDQGRRWCCPGTLPGIIIIIIIVIIIIIILIQLEKMDNEKSSWCACGHTLDNTISLACLPGLVYKFRVSAVNRLGDSEPLVSENISVSDGVDSSVR